MRPGQGAGIGSMGRAPLGTNLAAWTMAGRLSNFNNTNVLASPKTMAGRLSNHVLASPSISDRLGNITNKTNILSSSSRLNISNHLNKNGAQRPQSKVKRLNQENGPRFTTFNSNLSKNKAKALTKPSKNADGSVETVSRESLDCHMCNVSDFDSINDYILHLEGVNHTTMSKAYSSKCTANLELFRAEAKISALRAITKAIECKQDTQTQFCQKCQCTLVGGLTIHEKSSEHLQVLNYLGIRCCGTSFSCRLELEEHWLSLQHIQYRSKLLAKFKNQGLTLQKEDENMQKLSALARAEPHFDVSTWPAFDPTVPVGLKFVDTGASNKCRVCSEYLEPKAIVILSHCCSSKHYQNMCIFYKDLQKNNLQISEVKNQTDHNDQEMAKIDIILNSRTNKVKDVPSKDQEMAKIDIILNSRNNKVKEAPSKAASSPSETIPKDQEMAKIDSILNSRTNKVKEIPSKAAPSTNETMPKDSSTIGVNKQTETVVKSSPPKVSASDTGKEENEDFGTVLETSILSEDLKNESIPEEKSDKNCSVEDVKEDITEEVKEKTTVETKEILPVDSKDNSNTDQVKVETEQQSSVELSSSSSSLLSKLTVISEEECDVCENGSDVCEKHNAQGSPKRKNSDDLKVELGTPKKIRTEEPVVGTPTRRSRRRSVSEEPTTVSTPTRTSRRKSISEEPGVATPTRVSGRRKSITQL